MSGNLREIDPFSEMPMELESCEENDEAIEEGPKDNVETNIETEESYAESLTPEEIRWFYKDGVEKRWNEFCGYDSLRIEKIYQERQNLIGTSNDEINNENNLPPAERIVVRGGMYDVQIDNMKCVSIYWPGEEWEIMRATWYYDGSWIPLETEHSKVIEEVHLRLFQKESNDQSSSKCDASVPQAYKVLHTEQFSEFHVDWHSINDVILYSEYTPTKLMRSVTSKLGFAKTTGYRLKRGYKSRASMEDKPRDIDHLVFVVHGIGQKRDTGKIIRNTTWGCVDWLKQKYFPNSQHRVEFFAVEWRSSLKLDGDIVDAITPYSVLSIRHLLNTSAMDILYYTSPLYGAEVRAGLQKELNRLYFMFASRHPGWQGKVSILAHSLGCVIVYDIVTGWMGPDTRLPSPHAHEVLLQGLQFPIENLFCLGSPLSVFLALRTRTPSNRLDVMPQSLCKRFYNIFHWSDPVAYRMEPLLERGYSKIEPVLIPPYGGVDGQQIPQSPSSLNNVDPTLPPTETDDKDDSPTDIPNRAEKGWSLWDLVRGGWNVREGPSSPTPESNPPIRPGQELTQRLDYVLRAVGLGRNYLYTVAAHTAYWNNYDVAYFVLTRLFPTLES
ncbi:phospholipase DDHD1-like isoform X2 [Linepithema humile]|uniref:phospholipase DDHD1-like isoform X2 n=1 Tax=Linepithema humile TaxID=83485 RepID=UPI00351F31DE